MISGSNDYWVTGSRFYFQRDPVMIGGVLTPQPILDLGRFTNAPPNVVATDQNLMDGDGGIQRVVATATVSITETMEFRCSNMNMDNLAFLFASQPPTSFVQASTARTDVVHTAIPGRLMKILGTDGQPAFGITSVEAITSQTGSTTYVAGVDYEFVNPERGFIRWLESSSLLTTNTQVLVDYTPRAITGTNRRILNPQSISCANTIGTAIVYWGRCGNAEQTARVARVRLSSTGATFPDDNFADFGIRATVMTDPTKVSNPAGTLTYFLGQEPPRS